MTLFLEILTSKKLDIYHTVHMGSAISIPESLWFESLCSSLRRKHSVLILLSDFSLLPSWDPAKRWDVSDNWCWLSPRSLSVISRSNKDIPYTFETFFSYLKNHK